MCACVCVCDVQRYHLKRASTQTLCVCVGGGGGGSCVRYSAVPSFAIKLGTSKTSVPKIILPQNPVVHCVCVYVCVCVCARACARACVRVYTWACACPFCFSYCHWRDTRVTVSFQSRFVSVTVIVFYLTREMHSFFRLHNTHIRLFFHNAYHHDLSFCV